MGRRRYALERGGPKELEVRWGWRRKAFAVSLGGATWNLERARVEAGAPITLPDGSSLALRWDRRRFWSISFRDELHVERNGVPLPGSDGDPRVIGRRAGRVLLLFGFLRVVFVGLWTVFDRSGPSRVGGLGALGGMMTVAGLGLMVLGVLASFGARLPVLLGALLIGLEELVWLAGWPGNGARLSPTGVVIQVLVIAHLVRAWRRMKPRAEQPSLASVFE